MSATTYPVRVDAALDQRLSRWLWLVKWVLAIPHYFILAFLWIAYFVLSAVAFFAILFTGRYPRPIFDFNVGVLRWTWRVQYYAYGALGTDRYPPFSLQEVPGYPAHLEIDYPERLSRGLVLVKWWLLAIPQYLIVGLFAGGGTFAAWRLGSQNFNWAGGGLIGILVLVAAVILACTGRYPQAIFDFVLGMNRWVLRVAAYAGLMTDQYPPFRLDAGGPEPGSTLTLRPPAAPGGGAPGGTVLAGGTGTPGGAGAPAGTGLPGGTMATQPPQAAPPSPGAGWTAGRVVSVVAGSVLAMTAVGLFAGAGGVLWAGQAHRHGGYVTSDASTYATRGHALASDSINLPGSLEWIGKSLTGKTRIRVTATNPARPVFVGIAPAAAVTGYLSGVRYTTLTNLGGRTATISHLGSRVPADPARATFWAAHAAGTGTQALVWTPRAGDWVVVAMNPNASAGLAVRADVGATMPGLPWLAGGLLASGVLLAVAGALLIVVSVRRASA